MPATTPRFGTVHFWLSAEHAADEHVSVSHNPPPPPEGRLAPAELAAAEPLSGGADGC